MMRAPPTERRSRSASPVQADLFGSPSRPAPKPLYVSAAFPSASAEDVERVRVSTILMLFRLSSAGDEIGRVAGLYFMDALEAWHASRSTSSPDDPPF